VRFIWATFYCAGKYSLRILPVIRLYPGDFLGCMLLMTVWTSSSVSSGACS
jgi:hypothetical protein